MGCCGPLSYSRPPECFTMDLSQETAPSDVLDVHPDAVGDTDVRTLPRANVDDAAEDLLRSGAQLGARYHLIRRLGAGGMGVVYQARDVVLNELVAIKFLSPALSAHPQYLRRMQREVVVGRRVTHQNVCRIHDLGAEGRLRFVTMEFVEGQTLEELLSSEGLSHARALRLFLDVCGAVGAAHR